MRPDETIAALAEPPEWEVDRELVARLGLAEFARLAWPEIEADPLVWSWHLDEICAHLEAVSRGEIKRLVINVPPGCTKSKLVSVLWPAWDWITKPSRKWMFATFDSALTFRDANDCRKLVRSPWFQERWSDRVQINEAGDVQATQSVYHTTSLGRRVSVTVAGRATGWHGEIQVIDDPTKPKDISGDPDQAREALDKTINWFKTTMASRRSDPQKFARVIIMQRLHEDDLVGYVLDKEQSSGWVHLMLPMRFEPERKSVTPWGGDRRTKAGELLCPARFDEKAVAEAERDLGAQNASAQFQQRPAPAGGNVFQRDWFKERWKELPANLFLIQSWDCAFKDKAGSSLVAGHVWGYSKGKYYFVDRIADNMGLPATCNCIRAFMRRWPKARGKLIEDKANGTAVEQTLRDEVSGIVMIEPEGGKIARANAISPIAQAGNIILPDPSVCPWIDEVLELIVGFPFARTNDDIDAMTQAVIYLHDHAQGKYLEAMRRVRAGEVDFK